MNISYKGQIILLSSCLLLISAYLEFLFFSPHKRLWDHRKPLAAERGVSEIDVKVCDRKYHTVAVVGLVCKAFMKTGWNDTSP